MEDVRTRTRALDDMMVTPGPGFPGGPFPPMHRVPVFSTMGRGPRGKKGDKGNKGDTVTLTFADPIEWDITNSYEAYTVVLNEGDSYTSKKSVPAGVDIDNEEYWARTGDFNAQVEAYRREVDQEIANRRAAVNQEAAARRAGDSALDARVSNIIAQGQSTAGNTELIDIRTGHDGAVYPIAGDAVRGQLAAHQHSIDALLKGGVLYRADSVSVLESDGSYPAYVYHVILTKYSLSVGETYTFSAGSVTGSEAASPIVINAKKAGGATVRSSAGSLEAVMMITQNDVDDGLSYLEFVLYPAQGTGPLSDPAVFTDVSIYTGAGQLELGDLIVDAIEPVTAEVEDARLNDDLEYSCVGDVIRTQNEAMKDLVNSNVLYQAESVSVLNTDGPDPRYVYHRVLKKSNISVDDKFTLSVGSVTGASNEHPVAIYVKEEDATTIRAIHGVLSTTLTVTQADIDNGASYLEFLLYPAAGSALVDPAVFTDVAVYAGEGEQQEVGGVIADSINNKIAHLYMSNMLFETDSIEVSGTDAFVYKDVAIATNLAIGDYYEFKCDSVSGSTSNVTLFIYLDEPGTPMTHVRTIRGNGRISVTVTDNDIANGATQIRFRLYPATGTALPTGTATFTNVAVQKSAKPYEIGDYMQSMLDDAGALISNTVKTIAHRGDDVYAPQCTKAAYVIARKHGHTVAENDLWKSVDDHFIMWHDTSFARCGTYIFDINGYFLYTDSNENYYWYDETNSILYTHDYQTSSVDVSTLIKCHAADYGCVDRPEDSIVGLPFVVLRQIDVGSYKGFPGETLLTPEEWILLCKQLGMEIYIDKKLSLTDSEIETMFQIVNGLGMKRKTTWIISLLSEAQKIRSLDPNARLAILVNPSTDALQTWSNYIDENFVFNGNGKELTNEQAQIGLAAGAMVECWYVDVTNVSEEDQFMRVRELISYGITGLTWDHYRVDEAFGSLMNQYN